MRRRAFVATLLAAPALRTGPARAARVQLRLANGHPANYSTNVRLTEAFDRLREETGGEIDVRVFPAGELGADNDMFSQVRSGAIDLYVQAGSVMATAAPAAAINAVGYAFPGMDAVWQAMEGELGASIRQSLGRIGLRAHPRPMDNGYRNITSGTRPIRGVEDLHGFKIRVAQAPIYVSLFRALGAAPVSMSFGEVYSSLQTKLIDGQENPLVAIEQTRLFEVQRSVTLSEHTWDGFWTVANQEIWESLPTDAKARIDAAIDAAALAQRADQQRLAVETAERLRGHGLELISVDKDAFRRTLVAEGYYAEWKRRFGDSLWQVLQRYAGPLG